MNQPTSLEERRAIALRDKRICRCCGGELFVFNEGQLCHSCLQDGARIEGNTLTPCNYMAEFEEDVAKDDWVQHFVNSLCLLGEIAHQ